MAVKNENGYYKITEMSVNYSQQRTSVTLDVYRDESARLLEKEISVTVNNFLNNAYSHINEQQEILDAAIEAAPDKVLYDDADSFFNDHLDLKTQRDELFAKYDEYELLRMRLLTIGVDYDSLQYKNLWDSLGLTKDLCSPVDKLGLIKISLDDIKDVDLSELYKNIKETLSRDGKTEDC
jgi:hypothetical protein